MEELQLKSVMDEWGKRLNNKNINIFDVIEKAIKIAATDQREEFLHRRDEIAQCLYGCDFKEEEKTLVGQVLRIKTILADCKSESVVYESLKKLHKMGLSFKVVDAADIGNTVSRLQHHSSKQVKEIAEDIICSWIHKAMFDECAVDPYEKMPALHQQKEQTGGDLKKNETENQNVLEIRKSLKVRIKVIKVQDESAKTANVLDSHKITNKDTGVDKVLTSKGLPRKRSRDEIERVMCSDMLKKPLSSNQERNNIKVNSGKASVPKGRDEQRVKLIHSNGTMEEKLEAARRKLRETTKIYEKKEAYRSYSRGKSKRLFLQKVNKRSQRTSVLEEDKAMGLAEFLFNS